jgi:hypothetical protein
VIDVSGGDDERIDFLVPATGFERVLWDVGPVADARL